jgi:hypothetical protein
MRFGFSLFRPTLFCLALWLAAVQGAGCGGDDIVVGGNIPRTIALPTPTRTPSCLESGDPCTRSLDCCSGICLAGSLVCQ